MKSLDARIAYYTRKIAEYSSIHPSKRKNRHKRLLTYKQELNRRILEQKNNSRSNVSR